MKRRRALLLLSALAILVIFGAIFLWWTKEPVYQGKKLSAWLAMLEEGDSSERAQAEEAVGQIGSRAIPTLGRMLRARDSHAKEKFLEWLESIEFLDYEYVPASKTNKRAIHACELLGPKAHPLLPELAKLLDSNAVADAAWALVAIGPEGFDVLVRAAKNTNVDVRGTVASAFQHGLVEDERILPVLVELLNDRAPAVRSQVVHSLASFTNAPAQAIAGIARGFEDADKSVRASAAVAALNIGARHEELVAGLLRAVVETNLYVRMAAGQTLLKLYPERVKEAGLTTAALIEKLSDPDPNTRQVSVRLLQFQRDDLPSAVRALTQIVDDREIVLRRYAVFVLRMYGTNAVDAIPALEKAASSSNSELRLEAQEALKFIRTNSSNALPSPAR